jgi:hypothetical protein
LGYANDRREGCRVLGYWKRSPENSTEATAELTMQANSPFFRRRKLISGSIYPGAKHRCNHRYAAISLETCEQSRQRVTKRSPPKLITGAYRRQSTAGSYSTHRASCTFRKPEDSRGMAEAVWTNMDSVGGFILVYCIACCEQPSKSYEKVAVAADIDYCCFPTTFHSWLVRHGASCSLRDTHHS